MLNSNILQKWLDSNAKDWRREYKFITSHFPSASNAKEVFRFREQHQERIVNSIYFDTMNLDFLQDSLDGQPIRFKPRVRWYGNDGNEAEMYFEFKIRRGSAGGKIRILLGKLDPNVFTSSHRFRSWARRDSTIEPIRWIAATCFPTIRTRYRRRYFEGERKVRATLDYELTVSRFIGGTEFPAGPQRLPKTTPLIEVKCPLNVNFNVSSFLSTNVFRISRFSKYVTGLTYFHEQR